LLVERRNTTGRRLGGELPAFTDKLGPLQEWQPNWLPFSHGRAALAWWLQRQPARSVALCAYLCPSVPTFLRKRGIAIGTYDVGADVKEIVALVHQLPSPRLVLVPALFGSSPWLDIDSLAEKLDSTDRVIIDAAQSAFGHVEFTPPAGGAVLSCPRKSTSLTDGAVLAVSTMIGACEEIDKLPVAVFSAAMKAAARALWATEDGSLEQQAITYNRASEESWPDSPHRMTDQSLAVLQRLERGWHIEKRRHNCNVLAQSLPENLPAFRGVGGIPFSLPVFVADPTTTLSELHRRRIFASRLWPDAEYDPKRHHAAAWIAEHLVSLPIDQRCDADDMKRISVAIAEAAEPPSQACTQALRRFIFTRQ
jgi:hypothetical protein